MNSGKCMASSGNGSRTKSKFHASLGEIQQTEQKKKVSHT